jgi:colicin import membrane protein
VKEAQALKKQDPQGGRAEEEAGQEESGGRQSQAAKPSARKTSSGSPAGGGCHWRANRHWQRAARGRPLGQLCYGNDVRARVKPNIVFTDDVPGNPVAEVEVRAAPDGTIVGRKVVKRPVASRPGTTPCSRPSTKPRSCRATPMAACPQR